MYWYITWKQHGYYLHGERRWMEKALEARDTMGVWMFKFTISCVYTYVYIYMYLNPDQTYERKTFIPHDLFCFYLYLSFRLSSSHVIFFLLATQNICICIYIHYIYTAYIYILHKIKARAICLSCFGLFGGTSRLVPYIICWEQYYSKHLSTNIACCWFKFHYIYTRSDIAGSEDSHILSLCKDF